MGDRAPRAHVLIVDDTQAILDVMRELLENEGYWVSVSIETVELGRIKALQPDVIVQDLLFADSSQEMGWKFLTLVRLDPATAHIPLILCTAAIETVGDTAMAENLERLGVRVLLKPFTIDDLLMLITEVLAAQVRPGRAGGDDPAARA